MAENMFCKGMIATNDKYRDEFDRIFSKNNKNKKECCRENGKKCVCDNNK